MELAPLQALFTGIVGTLYPLNPYPPTLYPPARVEVAQSVEASG